jgi:lipoprotein NlpD
MILSCAGHPVRGDRLRGVYHRVKSGETLSVIAKAYSVDLQELAEINNISNPARIETGGVIFIPDANQIMDDVMTTARSQFAASLPGAGRGTAKPLKVGSKMEPLNKGASAEPKKRKEMSPADIMVNNRIISSPVAEIDAVSGKTKGTIETETIADHPVIMKENDGKGDQLQFDKKRFAWPVKGVVISHFGIQPSGLNYKGIRIAAGKGAAVQAAADGVVISSAFLKGYGETIIIEHEDQYATVYSNLGGRNVQRDYRVSKGERIGSLGKDQEHVETYLDFEIRHNFQARNPIFFLP